MGRTCAGRIGGSLLCAAALLASSSCVRTEGTAAGAVDAFARAVQEEDLDRLYCLSAGASEAEELGRDDEERRSAFAAWARAELQNYLDGRDAGWVELDGHGVRLVKLFALGRGTFYDIAEQRSAAPDAVRVGMSIHFGYPQVDLSGLSPGTTFYLSGAPAGRVHAVRVPSGPEEISLEVLDSLTVDWTLVRAGAAGGCPAGWRVASVEPRGGSLTTTEVTWVF